MGKFYLGLILGLSLALGYGCGKKEEGEQKPVVTQMPPSVEERGVAPMPESQAPGEIQQAQPMMQPQHPPVKGAMPPHPISENQGKPKEIVVKDEVRKKWSTVSLLFVENGKETPITVKIGEKIKIPNTNLTIAVESFLPDYTISGNNIATRSNEPNNPAVLVELLDGNKSLAKGWVFERLPDFNSYRHEKYQIVLLPVKKG